MTKGRIVAGAATPDGTRRGFATAVASASSGSTVKGLPGVYTGGVSFSKQLDLEGQAAALDASSSPDGYGIEVAGPGGSGSVIAGSTASSISYDVALDNTDDCGITFASHTTSQIYGNTIDHNVADGNGVAGQGAGILMAGTGVHDNTVSNNEASGNGLSGITIHDHFPGNFNNNVITNNHLSNNNVDGHFDFLTPAPLTTDILIAAETSLLGPRGACAAAPTWYRPGPSIGVHPCTVGAGVAAAHESDFPLNRAPREVLVRRSALLDLWAEATGLRFAEVVAS